MFLDPTKLFNLPVAALSDPTSGRQFTGGFANSSKVNVAGMLRPPPNAEFQEVYNAAGDIECVNIVATRSINCTEEIIVDYHWTMQEVCTCGSIECRNTI